MYVLIVTVLTIGHPWIEFENFYFRIVSQFEGG